MTMTSIVVAQQVLKVRPAQPWKKLCCQTTQSWNANAIRLSTATHLTTLEYYRTTYSVPWHSILFQML